MHTFTPTKDTGAVAKADSAIYAESGRTVTDEDLAAEIGLDGVNGAFISDLLSACLTHERCGAHLYRSVAGRTANPVLRARYEEFGRETMRHVEILERVIETAGGNPSYVSPLARAVETADSKALEATFLGSGALDASTAEMAMLDAVLVAETIDHANWEALGLLADSLPNGLLKDALRDAVAEVEDQEDEHLGWARDMRARMTMLQVSSSLLTEAAAKGEELVAQVRSWFSGGSGLDVPVRRAAVTPSARPAMKKRATKKKTAATKKSATKKKAAAKKKATAKKAPAKRKSATKKAAATKKKATKKKTAATKKSTATRPAAKKATTKKATTKKATKRTATTRKTAAKRSPAKKKAPAKKATAKKRSTTTKRSAAKRSPAKKATKKKAAAKRSAAKKKAPAKKPSKR